MSPGDDGENGLAELGDLLRETRESKGLSLEQVEEATRIRRSFLHALEEERFSDLPGEVYVRGFVRNYAQFLGLDPDELLAEYRSRSKTALSDVPQVLDEPLLTSSVIKRGLPIVLGVVAFVALVVLGWFAYNRFFSTPLNGGTASKDATVTATPTSTNTPSATGRATVEPTTTKAMGAAATLRPTATDTRRPTATVTRMRPTPSATMTPMVGATPSPEALPSPAVPEEIRVKASVTADTWLLVRVDGERVLEAILSPGDTRVWVGEESVTLRVGNAAGLVLVVNGIEIPPLGEQGEVVDLEYTLDNLPTGQE